MGNMRLRYRIPLAVIAIMMVMTLFVGSSYALWKVTKYQESENVIATGCFDVSFIEKSSSINLNNTYPMTDEKGKKTSEVYAFTIENICTTDVEYTVYLNTLAVDTGKKKIADNLIKYLLVEKKDASSAPNLLDSAAENTKDINSFDYTFDTSYILRTGKLKGRSSKDVPDGGKVELSLRLWIDSTASNKEFKSDGSKNEKYIDDTYQFKGAIASVAYATKIEAPNTPTE